MADITLRNVKGSPLTNAEVDANFNNLNTEVVSKLDAETYTATDVITKIKSVSVANADINVNKLNGYSASTSNTINTVVARDSNGDFAAGTITADKLYSSYIQVGGAASDVNSGVTTINGGKITANSIDATKLTAQTFIGAAKLLESSGKSATTLRENVTSPNGTTAAALASFSDSKLNEIVLKADESGT